MEQEQILKALQGMSTEEREALEAALNPKAHMNVQGETITITIPLSMLQDDKSHMSSTGKSKVRGISVANKRYGFTGNLFDKAVV